MKDADFRSFIKGERQKLIRYVQSLIRDSADMDAEDVVHDVFLKMLERPDPVDPLTNLTGYVYRAMKNRVIDSVRARNSTVSLDADEDGPGLKDIIQDLGPSVLDQLQSQQGKEAMFEALTRLTDIERRVVVAHEFEGVSFRELSITLDMPQNTLLSHKSRAMKKLKEHLSLLK